MDLHTLARTLGQGLGELPADVARPVDVGLEVDRHLGRADRREHRREDLFPVQQRLHACPGQEGRPEQDAQVVHEACIVERVEALDVPLDLLLAADEVRRERTAHQRQAGRGPGEHEPCGARLPWRTWRAVVSG